MKTLLLCLALTFSTLGCQHAPPTLTPAAQLAFQGTRAIKGLDLLRDFAVDANAQIPPVISTDTTRKIVIYHRSAITLIHDVPNGWKATVLTGLAEVVRDAPAGEAQKFAPYVGLLKGLLAEVN